MTSGHPAAPITTRVPCGRRPPRRHAGGREPV